MGGLKLPFRHTNCSGGQVVTRTKIMQTRDSIVDSDDFDPDEAMEAAVNKRKFLIKRLLKDYSFTGENDDKDE